MLSARSSKRLPGRKSDGGDCPWLQTLHRYGFLAASFRPEAARGALRTLWRPRAPLWEPRAPPLLQMPKALVQINLQLSQALTDVTGATGLQLRRAIVAGERDPQRLATLRHDWCKQEAEESARALTGTWRADQLGVLSQALDGCECSPIPLRACDTEIARPVSGIPPRYESSPEEAATPDAPTPPQSQPNSPSQPAPAVNPRVHILRITGVELVAGHGIRASLAPPLIAESGTDMSQGAKETPCCSCLGLAPT